MKDQANSVTDPIDTNGEPMARLEPGHISTSSTSSTSGTASTASTANSSNSSSTTTATANSAAKTAAKNSANNTAKNTATVSATDAIPAAARRPPKWWIVARNEYRLHTSAFRSLGRFRAFIIPTVGIIGIILLILGIPPLVEQFTDDLTAFFLSATALALIQLALLMFFLIFLSFPISLAMKDIRPDEYELFLAAPIRPGSVLLGKFVGALPLYAIGIGIVTSVFAALLAVIGFGNGQIAVVVALFVLTLMSAFWIGMVLAAALQSRLARSAKGADVGKALSFIIILPLLGFMYWFMGGNATAALSEPGASASVTQALWFLPSSWGAELIIEFAHQPGAITGLGLETLRGLGGTALFFIGALAVGTWVANRVYSLEHHSFSGDAVKGDGLFYSVIRSLGGGGAAGALLVSFFKIYVRRRQNISKIAYVVGLIVLMLVFIGDHEDPSSTIFQSYFGFPLLAAFVASEVTLRGKENLFMIRKAPCGLDRFMRLRLIHGWLIVIPIAGAVSYLALLLGPPLPLPLWELVGYTALIMLGAAAAVPFALGLFLIRPAYEEKSGEFMLNIMIITLTSVALIIIGIETMLRIYESLLVLLAVVIAIQCTIGAVIYRIGKRSLERLE